MVMNETLQEILEFMNNGKLTKGLTFDQNLYIMSYFAFKNISKFFILINIGPNFKS